MESEPRNSARRVRVFLILFLVCFIAVGCTLVKLRKEVSESLASTILVGHISTPSPGKGPLVVAAYSMNKGKREIAHYTVLHDSGEYELMVSPGNYYVFAYWDKNSNLVYEAGEPAGQYGDPKLVSVSAGGVVLQIDFVIPENGSNVDFPHGSKISPVKPKKLHSRLAGAIVDLDDERFSDEYGKKGFWEPVEFYKELGGNIYFLEEYDPKKIPILFVHGATGTPAGWEFFINNIDRTRFQPWFFYYPSGARIKSMSYLLFWKLFNLQIKYKFVKMYITAHSMGGLVVRSFIMDYGRYFPYVKLFISLATPWGGDRMAEYGVKQSPAVIPSWIDMQPEGEFIKSLYRTKMPETISFYMFSGHRGGRNPFQSNNDGTITLSSILDLRPQAEAKMNYAFNEDHASIAFSKEVLAQYNTIINMFDEKSSASNYLSGGYLQLHFSYDYPFADVRPWPSLLLRPIGKKHAETVISLSANDSGRILGPFPPGDYSASMIAIAANPGGKDVPVSIASNQTKDLNFVFTPDGTISGYVTTAMKPEDRPVGMPAERYLAADKKITIQSITVMGAGIHRILHPLEGEDVDYTDYVISRTDFCYKGYFNFFGLPAGVYELAIHAQGYKSIVEKYSVMPGKQEEQKVTELTPEEQ
ncbi:MAG: alpha/beta hydrolase [Syntrophales bacterium]|nr:alpha/beta hydrolase [Syntrophales bacterium]